MPRKIKDENERAMPVNISVKRKTLQALDNNVLQLQEWLISKGVEEKNARAVTRSALIAEMVYTLASEAGLTLIKGGILAQFGIDDSQCELFPKV